MKYIKMLITWIWLLFANDNKKEVKSSKLFLPMKLQYFSDGGDGGGDGGNGGSGDEGGNGGSGDEPFATFKTQDDFNKRLGRAEKKGQKELAKTLGFDSVEEMQAALDKTKKKEPNNNMDPNNTDPIDVDAVVESKLKEERDKTFKRLVNSEVKLNANELGFADWEDALALADLSQVKEDDKGNIVGVKAALEELGKKKPHLLKQSNNGGFGATVPNNQQGQKETLDNMKRLAASRGNTQTITHNPWA